jgi:hypothetical protein
MSDYLNTENVLIVAVVFLIVSLLFPDSRQELRNLTREMAGIRNELRILNSHQRAAAERRRKREDQPPGEFPDNEADY